MVTKILLLSANPTDTSKLRLDREVRENLDKINWAFWRDISDTPRLFEELKQALLVIN